MTEMTEPTPPPYVARCVRCDTSFTDAEIENASACPHCGSKGIPMDPAYDVTVRANVHELRVLGIWAENYAVSCDNAQLDNAYHQSLKETVAAITARLEAQLRALNRHMPLTLSRELSELKSALPTSDVQFYRDGQEEIVE